MCHWCSEFRVQLSLRSQQEPGRSQESGVRSQESGVRSHHHTDLQQSRRKYHFDRLDTINCNIIFLVYEKNISLYFVILYYMILFSIARFSQDTQNDRGQSSARASVMYSSVNFALDGCVDASSKP